MITMDTQVFSEKHGSSNGNGNMKLPPGISANTYVSVGLFAMILAGFWAVLNTIYSAKSEISSRMDKVEWNQNQMRQDFNEYKSRKSDAITWGQWFRWSVKFQRDNPQIKIPEPENDSP